MTTPGFISRRRLLEAGALGGSLALAGGGVNAASPGPRVQRYAALGATGLSISDMTSRETIDEYLGASGGEAVSDEDWRLLEHYASLNRGHYCRHGCNDCAGACPYGVPIGDVLRVRMYAIDYRDVAFAREEYARLEVDAASCASCSGEPCRSACSHGLSIDRLCKPVHGMLS